MHTSRCHHRERRVEGNLSGGLAAEPAAAAHRADSAATIFRKRANSTRAARTASRATFFGIGRQRQRRAPQTFARSERFSARRKARPQKRRRQRRRSALRAVRQRGAGREATNTHGTTATRTAAARLHTQLFFSFFFFILPHAFPRFSTPSCQHHAHLSLNLEMVQKAVAKKSGESINSRLQLVIKSGELARADAARTEERAAVECAYTLRWRGRPLSFPARLLAGVACRRRLSHSTRLVFQLWLELPRLAMRLAQFELLALCEDISSSLIYLRALSLEFR